MRLEDYNKKTFNNFFGMWSRGKVDEVPLDHFSDALNIDWNGDEWKTRGGLYASINLGYGAGTGKVRRFASFADPNIGPLVLILDDAGNLYTYSTRSGDEAAVPRLTDVNADDFSAIKMLNKIYIAFHNGQVGSTNSNLKVFIPGSIPAQDEFRDAAGLAPINSAIVAVDGAAGVVNAGTYKIAVSYITSSGFVTQPGPKVAGVFTPTTYVSPGTVKINLSNLPIGPAGTISRQILITKADLEEYFFLPSAFGGLINDNTSTTAVLDFDDTTDLVDSADYLFDLLETIPAPLVLQDYNQRLGIGGMADEPSVMKFSYPGEPEAFDAIDSRVNVSIDDGFTIRNAMVMRNVFYIWKNLGAFATTDNEDVPSTWHSPEPIDQVVNAGIHGIAEFFDISGIRLARDWTLVADRSGILLFDGIVRKPPITEKINDIWQTINYAKYHKIVLVVDEQNHKIYCAIPINYSLENNLLLMGDYDSCPGNIPEARKIRWSKWEFRPCNVLRNPTEIGMFGFPPDVVPTLKIASMDGNSKIYSLSPFMEDDNGDPIESYFNTPLMFWEEGSVHFFTAARLRVTGDGTILCDIRGEDDFPYIPVPLPNIALSSSLLASWRFISESFIGNDTTSVFTLCNTPSTFIGIFQNGLLIQEGVDYTVSGDQITFTVVPVLNDTIQVLYIFGSPTTQFRLEIPTGAIDGVNTNFVTSSDPSDVYVGVWQNGLLVIDGTHYTRSGDTITFITAPQVNDTIQVLFHVDLLEPGFVLETPPEVPDGSNSVFTISGPPSSNFVVVFQNGLALRYIKDFFYSNGTIIFYTPPQVGDTLQFLFRSIVGGVNRIVGQERLIRFNFQNEKARIKFRMTSGRFIVNKLELYGQPVYTMRPA